MKEQGIWRRRKNETQRELFFILRCLLSVCCALLIVIFSPCLFITYASEKESRVNRCDLTSLLRVYDPDAYEILRSELAHNWDYTPYLSDPDRPVDSIGTIVHEAFHSYSYTHGVYSWNPDTKSLNHSEAFYLGRRQITLIRYEDIFPSEKAAKGISAKHRTIRYAAYVGKGSELSSNQDGIYGLFNEFCAYYWGMHAMEAMYPYLKKHATSVKDWKVFVTDYCNYRNAYAEFYLYMLEYFRYAKRFKPDVYDKLLGNRDFLCTLRTMQQRYEKLIHRYERKLNTLSRQYNGRSLRISSEHGIVWLGSYGWGAGDDAYDILMPIILSRKYKIIHRQCF